jgi:diguanylate cyclase (GGDEF)-like protein
MYLDAFTILIFGILVKSLLGALFLAFWLSSRAAWFAWWSAALAIGAIAAGFFLRGFGGEFLVVGVAVASLVAAFGCVWQGARAFERRKPLWLPLIAAPAIWLAACAVPGFLDHVAYRVALSSALLASLNAATAYEFWRGRDERLPSRWTVIVLFSSLALVFAIRIPLIQVAPFPFGALPAQPPVAALFNVILFFHTLLLSVLLVALTKERLEGEQRTHAQTDSLTGALNRRAFLTVGHRLLARHERKRDPLGLLFIDLDHFKALNDRYGHSGGDNVLVRFVQFVQINIRPTDFLFRLGGEEFCCLLPYTTPQEALAAAERIRSEAEAAMFEVGRMPIRLTVSIGVASTSASGYDLDMLVRHADAALYAAKQQGRNRVMVAEPEMADQSIVPAH